VALEYVGVVEFLQCLDLPLQHFFFWFALNGPDIDDFNGDFLFGFIVGSSIDD
jgi:hypothetical protein